MAGKTTKEKQREIAAHKKRTESGVFVSEKGPPPLDEFDLDTLTLLPDEGAMKGRYMPDARNSSQIKRELDPTLTSGFVASRLKMLRDRGMVVSFSTIGMGNRGGQLWQRTEVGRKALAEARPLAAVKDDDE